MHELIDEITYSKRKTVAIEVKPGGRVIVRAPKGTRKILIEQFVREKSGWITQAKARMGNMASADVQQHYHDGAQVLYLGRSWRLIYLNQVKKGLAFKREQGFLLQEDQIDDAAELLKEFYREETRKLAAHYIDQYAPKWDLKVNSLRITSAKTRWGSCSVKNTLNFSYRLAMLPPEAFEYVVVHELAHIRHHNHSSAFWSFAAQMLPEYQQRRQWLKQNGRKLPNL